MAEAEAEVEVCGFGKLFFLFKERGWENPHIHKMSGSLTARELMDELDIPAESVEVAFINRAIMPLSTRLKDGDRVAYVPPGVPSIHRFNLGFYDAKETDRRAEKK
ncbi:MAG: MoaD/ThiS family protein [Bacillota bacterium]|nr:MoaD/ThiS family protein [Bacillota bacterium]